MGLLDAVSVPRAQLDAYIAALVADKSSNVYKALVAYNPPPALSLAKAFATDYAATTRMLAVSDATITDAVPTTAGQFDITVDDTTTYQTMIGFGAAVTDASAWLLMTTLDASRRTALLRELFSPSQGGLSVVRISIGASDFSYQNWYTYAETANDTSLTSFSIGTGTPGDSAATRDLRYVVPVLQEIMSINPAVRVIAAPWTPPVWMKDNNTTIGGNWVGGATNSTAYANYFVKFIQAYKALGIPIYAVAHQNEPSHNSNFPACVWTPAQTRDFIVNYLAPAFTAANLDVKLMAGDENWSDSANTLSVVKDAATAAKLTAIAWHGYGGTVPTQATVAAQAATKLDTWFTEWRTLYADSSATNGEKMFNTLGVQIIANGASLITLWNLALDQTGMPTRNSTGRKGVVTLSTANPGTVTRNQEYAVLRTLAQTVKRGAVRVAATASGTSAFNAFKNPDGSLAVYILNTSTTTARTFGVIWGGKYTTVVVQPQDTTAVVIASSTTTVNTTTVPAISGILAGTGTLSTGPIDPTPPPDPSSITAPTNDLAVTASPTSTGNLLIAFTGGQGYGVTVSVYRGTSASVTPSTGTLVTQSTPYNDSGLTNGTTYYYVATATNTKGTVTSPVVSATPSATATSAALAGSDSYATPANTGSYSFTHTVPTNTKLALVALSFGVVSGSGSSPQTVLPTGQGVTLGGTAMTLVGFDLSTGGASTGHNRGVALYSLANPTAGAQTVAVATPKYSSTDTDFPSSVATALSFTGATTVSGLVKDHSTTTTSTTKAVTETPAGGAIMVAAGSFRAASGVASVSGAGTTVTNTLGGTNTAQIVATTPGDGSAKTTTFTLSAANQIAVLAAVVS